jgi:hypothetical protein
MFRSLRLDIDNELLVLFQEGKEADEGELSLLDHTLDGCTTIPKSIQDFTAFFRDTFPSEPSEESKGIWSQTFTAITDTLSDITHGTGEHLKYGGPLREHRRKVAKAEEQAKEREEKAKKAEDKAKDLLEKLLYNPPIKRTFVTTRKFILETYDDIRAQNPDGPDYAPLGQVVRMVMDDAIPWTNTDQENQSSHAYTSVQRLLEADEETQKLFQVIFSLRVNSGTGHRLFSVTDLRWEYNSYKKLTIQAWRVAWYSKP